MTTTKDASAESRARDLINVANRRAELEEVRTKCRASEDDVLSEPTGNFELLVEKIDNLTSAVGKLEKRFDRDSQGLFDRVRKVELDGVALKTKVVWLVGGASVLISALVSLITALIVFYLKSNTQQP